MIKRLTYSGKSAIGILLMVFLFLYGCEYQTDDIYTRNLDKDAPLPDLTLDINLNADTIYVYNYTRINFKVNLTNKTFYEIKFFLNDQELSEVSHYSTDYCSFTLDLSSYTEPVKIRAEVYTSTNTGSIADKLRAEAFVLNTKEWVLINIHENLKLTYEILDGRLKISWPENKNHNFDKYLVYCGNKIDSTSNNWYIDSSFIGGNRNYSVTSNDNNLSGFGVYQEITYPYTELNLNNRDSFYIYWSNPLFYNNIEGSKLTISDFSYGSVTTKYFNSHITSYTFKEGVFGANYLINLKYWNKTDTLQGDLNKIAYYPSSFFPDYLSFDESFFPLTGKNIYCILNYTDIIKFSLSSKSITKKITNRGNYFAVSANDKYFIQSNESEDIRLYDAKTCNEVKTIRKNKIVGNSSYFSLNITDNAISAIYNSISGKIVIYDLINELEVSNITVPVSTPELKISPNGTYVFIPRLNSLYQIENNNSNLLWYAQGDYYKYTYIEFSPINSNILALYDGDTFYLKDCISLTNQASFSLNNKALINVDFENLKILCRDDLNFYIFSLETGEMLRVIPSSSFYHIRLINNYILSPYCQLNLNYQ